MGVPCNHWGTRQQKGCQWLLPSSWFSGGCAGLPHVASREPGSRRGAVSVTCLLQTTWGSPVGNQLGPPVASVLLLAALWRSREGCFTQPPENCEAKREEVAPSGFFLGVPPSSSSPTREKEEQPDDNNIRIELTQQSCGEVLIEVYWKSQKEFWTSLRKARKRKNLPIQRDSRNYGLNNNVFYLLPDGLTVNSFLIQIVPECLQCPAETERMWTW